MPRPLSSNTSSSMRQTTAKTVQKIEVGLLLHSAPPAPPTLNAEGKKWWDYYCALLLEGRCLSRFYITSIENLCIAHMGRQQMIEEIRNSDFFQTKVDKDGNPSVITNTVWKDLETLLIKMSKLLTDLGLTAYSAKVNNIDTSGGFQQQISTPPTIDLPPQKTTPSV